MPKSAIAAYERSSPLFHREAARVSPVDGRRTLWADLNKITNLKLGIGDVDGALAAAEESLAIARAISSMGAVTCGQVSRLSQTLPR